MGLIWNGLKGQIIRFDPKTTPEHILEAIKPIESDKDLKEYRGILKKLIDGKNELIAEYQAVIKKLEVKNGSKIKE